MNMVYVKIFYESWLLSGRFWFLNAVLWMVMACQNPEKTPVDKKQKEEEVTSLLNTFHKTLKDKDAAAMLSFLTDDGLFCGTDPGELWNKQAITDYMTQALADTAMTINNYRIDNRVILVDDSGVTATVIEQFKADPLSKRIPTRLVTHLVNKDNRWMIDFQSWSMVPTNEDLLKINEQLN